MAITKKTPTPTATAPTSVALGTPGTCWASTWRSGSDTVTMTPIRKPTAATTQSFLERVMAAPTRSPMGVMAVSAPRENRPMPRIGITTAKIQAMRPPITTAITKANTSISGERMAVRMIII